jgi:protein associated with RNAse G/E
LKAAPSNIHVVHHITAKQLGYGDYVCNLSAFLCATFTKRRTRIGLVGYDYNIPPTVALPPFMPPVMISKKTVSASEEERIKSMDSNEINKRNNQRTYIITKYNLDDLRWLVSQKFSQTCFTVQNSTNIESLRSLNLVSKLLAAVLYVQKYPAFMDKDHLKAYLDYVLEEKTKADEEKKMTDDEEYNPEQPDLKKQKTEGSADTSQAKPVQVLINQHHDPTLSHAKPVKNTNQIYGGPDTLPPLPGIWCRFLHDLCDPDNSTVPDFINDYLIASLGMIPKTQSDKIHAIRSAWGNIAKTNAGNVLAHLTKCIRIGLNCQAQVYPLFTSDRYEGSVILGEGFSITVCGIEYKPIVSTELRRLIAESGTNIAILREIAQQCHDDDVMRCNTMRELSQLLRTKQLSEIDKKNLLDKVKHLDFGESFWGVNVTSISKSFDYIGNPEAPIETGEPMHYSAVFYTSRIQEVLSAYGPMAPSFMIPASRVIKLTAKTEMPELLVVRIVVLSTAVFDWNKMLETKSITNNPSNLGRNNANRPFRGDDKSTLWKCLLQSIVNNSTDSVPDNVSVSDLLNDTNLGGGISDDF